MAEIGTATIKVMPDLSDFTAALDAAPDGFTLVEVTEYERDNEGRVTKETMTRKLFRSV
jgi:hypothetical protein